MQELTNRNRKIYREYKNGLKFNMTALAEKYGLSVPRVSEIIKNYKRKYAK